MLVVGTKYNNDVLTVCYNKNQYNYHNDKERFEGGLFI